MINCAGIVKKKNCLNAGAVVLRRVRMILQVTISLMALVCSNHSKCPINKQIIE